MPAREAKFKIPIQTGGGSSTVEVPCAVGNYGKSKTAVLICHPWNQLGGNMHNNVVVAAALYFQRLGLTTCRFDFLPHSWFSAGFAQVEQVKQISSMLVKGTETLDQALSKSSSSFRASTTGEAETDARRNNDDNLVRPTSLILVGYSYGSLITGSASAEIPECVATISIAPPWGVGMWLLSFRSNQFTDRAAKRTDIYRFFCIGDEDNFTSEASFQKTLDKYFFDKDRNNDNTQAAILRGADHFFHQREKDLMNVIGQWLQQTFEMDCKGDLKRLPLLDLPRPSHDGSNATDS